MKMLDRKKNNCLKNKKRLALVTTLLMVILIILTSISLVLATSSNLYYYNLELYYNKGNIYINNIEIEFSSEEKYNFNKNNSYYLEIVDNNKKILDEIFFDVPNFVIYDFADEQGNFIETNESGLKLLENVSFNVFASYYENGYEVVVYNKNGKELDRSFVSQFSKLGFSREDFLGEKINEIENDINKSRDKEVKERSEAVYDYKNYIIVLSLVLIFLIILLIYFLRKRK